MNLGATRRVRGQKAPKSTSWCGHQAGDGTGAPKTQGKEESSHSGGELGQVGWGVLGGGSSWTLGRD